jgi:hypothetical protein
VIYHLSHTPSPFCFSYSLNRVSCFCLGCLDHYTPIYTCCTAGITSMNHHAQLIDWDDVSQTFLLTLNHNPPDSYLLSSWDYRHEPPHLTYFIVLNYFFSITTRHSSCLSPMPSSSLAPFSSQAMCFCVICLLSAYRNYFILFLISMQ